MEISLTQDDYYRYSRQIAVEGIGIAGQNKLKNSCIVIVGVGGVGCAIALYAASCGIGHLILIDPDRVALSNLHRQILYQATDVGTLKVQTAAQKLKAINPSLQIQTFPYSISQVDAPTLLSQADLIIDGTDNYIARYYINWLCVTLKKPFISASIYSWSGQLAFFNAACGPCYACVYPAAPAEDLIPNCHTAGTLGVIPGIVALQALNEGLKYLLELPVRNDNLLVYDAKTSHVKHYPIMKKQNCPICMKHTVTLEDFMQYNPKSPPVVPTIDCSTLNALRTQGKQPVLVDVREPWERDICKIEGSLLIPLSQFEEELPQLNPQDSIILHCRSGGRSACATKILQDRGYTHVHNLEGGILSWIDQIDPTQMKY